KAFLAASLAPFICVAVLHALLSAIMLLLRTWRDGQVAHAFVVAPPLVLFAFSITVVVLIGMMGRESTEGVREWWSRLGAWLPIGVSTIIDVVVTKNAAADWWHLAQPDEQGRFFRVSLVALAGCAATLFLLGFRIDINEFSLNAFYRNRLVRCFLGAARTAP